MSLVTFHTQSTQTTKSHPLCRRLRAINRNAGAVSDRAHVSNANAASPRFTATGAGAGYRRNTLPILTGQGDPNRSQNRGGSHNLSPEERHTSQAQHAQRQPDRVIAGFSDR